MTPIRTRLASVSDGGASLPWLLLFAFFLVDEADTAVTNVLFPTIRREFAIAESSLILIAIIGLTVVLAFSVPVGYLGDRIPRKRIALVGAAIAGVCTMLTGLAPTFLLLAAARIGNGVGKLINESVHPSLLADYYPASTRPKIFAAHRSAHMLGAVTGSAFAGVLGALIGWRAAFVLFIFPIAILMVVASRRLNEPVRGASDGVAEELDAVAFAEARRTLWAVPTLRRLFVAQAFVGAGSIPVAIIGPILLDEYYGIGELGRGVLAAVQAVAAFAGVALAGRLAKHWFERDTGYPLVVGGASLIACGVGIVGVAATSSIAVVVALSLFTSFTGAAAFPGSAATHALVTPARVRTLSYSFGAVFLVGGVWFLYYLPGIARISDVHGPRWGMFAVAPFFCVAGAIQMSARRRVAADAHRALQSQPGTLAPEHEGALLRCAGVEVSYDSVQVLFGVDLAVYPGECVALLGTNGAGKSTLLRAISGLVDVQGGEISFNGRDITHADGVATATAGIVHVPGGRAMFPSLTVAEHIRLAGWLHGDDPAHLNAQADQVFERFPRLRERETQMAGNLSGGEQQMLAIGMALIAKPKLLIIDELSLGLAPVIVEQLLNTLREIQASGTALLLVEQSMNVAMTIAGRAYFMEKGEVRFSGTTADLLARDDVARSVFLASANDALTPAKKRRRKGRDEERRAFGEVVLEVRDVSVAFGGTRAVDRASLQVRRGEIVGVIGPNGAGKTTIFDLISGFVAPDAGAILANGHDITALRPEQRAAYGIGRSFQDARLASSLSVSECIALGFDRHIAIRDHFASALRLPGIVESEQNVAWAVSDLIELLNLGPYRDHLVGELSTGTRRIVDLAMSLANEPDVLLLDEPTSGIAQRESESLGPLLRTIQHEVGCGLLIIEHDMALITSVSDRMIALHLGHPIAEGAPADVIRDQTVIASYLGTDPAAVARSGSVS